MRAGVPGAVRREDGAFAKAGVRTRSYDVSAEQARAALAKVAEYKAHAPTFSFARRDCGQFAADVLKAARIEGFAGPGVRRPAELYRQVQRGVQAKIAPLEVWSRASCTAGGVRHVSVEGTAAARGDRVQMYFASEDRLRLGGSKLQRPIQRALKSKDWWEDELATNPFYSQRMGPLKAAGSTEYEAMRSPLHELGVETDPTIINKAIALLPIEKTPVVKNPDYPYAENRAHPQYLYGYTSKDAADDAEKNGIIFCGSVHDGIPTTPILYSKGKAQGQNGIVDGSACLKIDTRKIPEILEGR